MRIVFFWFSRNIWLDKCIITLCLGKYGTDKTPYCKSWFFREHETFANYATGWPSRKYHARKCFRKHDGVCTSQHEAKHTIAWPKRLMFHRCDRIKHCVVTSLFPLYDICICKYLNIDLIHILSQFIYSKCARRVNLRKPPFWIFVSQQTTT